MGETRLFSGDPHHPSCWILSANSSYSSVLVLCAAGVAAGNAAQAMVQGDVVATSGGVNPQGLIQSAVLKLNGTDRFAVRPASYFNRVQPYQHHSGKPDLGICCYSFALKPEEHQPSGTCNFSRIDNADLRVTLRPDCNAAAGALNASLFVYAHGYNVLRVASGMGGLAYSN